MDTLKIGDVVYLKSGSNPMTITAVNDGKCHVAWHENGKAHTDFYPQETLTKDDPNDGPVV